MMLERRKIKGRNRPPGAHVGWIPSTCETHTSQGLTAMACASKCAPRSSGPEPMKARAGKSLVKRSEEHTSELQSLAYLVCRLLLEKKKKASNEHIALIYMLEACSVS